MDGAGGATFEDQGARVAIRVPLDGGEAVVPECTGTFLALRLATTGKTVFCVPQLFGTVLADRTTVEQDGKMAVVWLTKTTPSERWPQMELPDMEGPETEVEGAGEALSVRERVKRLLTAARIGNVEELGLARIAFEADGSNLADVKDANSRNALHFAAAAGEVETCKYLVEQCRIRVDDADDEGLAPKTMSEPSGPQRNLLTSHCCLKT